MSSRKRVFLPYDYEVEYIANFNEMKLPNNAIIDSLNFKVVSKIMTGNTNLTGDDYIVSLYRMGNNPWDERKTTRLFCIQCWPKSSGGFGFGGFNQIFGQTQRQLETSVATSYINKVCEIEVGNSYIKDLTDSTTLFNDSKIETVVLGNQTPTVAIKHGSRLYYEKIWKDDNLILDIIPVVKDGKGCLYDKITKKLLKPSLTDIIIGPRKN